MKSRKLRGSGTAGRGYGKRARKAGNRGGRGKAGGGKRGQQKLVSINANRPQARYVSSERKIPINLSELSQRIIKWEKDGKVKRDNGMLIMDLKKLGYSKVCGSFGKDKYKLAVYGKASSRAANDIRAAGGEVYA